MSVQGTASRAAAAATALALAAGSVLGPDPAAAAKAGTAYQEGQGEASAPASARAVLPAGRTFRVRLDHSIYTGRAREGDRVTAILVDDLYAGDEIVAEAGSEVRGRIVYVARAQETHDQAALELRFDRIIPADGSAEIPISAKVISQEIDDRARRAERDADIAWTVGGALLGTVIGNQSSNRSRGRATGAAIGAVTGLLISTQTGSNFTLREGTRLTLELNRSARVY